MQLCHAWLRCSQAFGGQRGEAIPLSILIYFVLGINILPRPRLNGGLAD